MMMLLSILRCSCVKHKPRKIVLSFLSSAWLITCLATIAISQIPDSAQPGRTEKRFEKPPIPKAQPEIHLRSPRQVPPDEAGQIRFVLAGIEFEGNTVYKSSEFLHFYEKLVTKPVSLNDIYMIADAITAFYRAASQRRARRFGSDFGSTAPNL